MKKLGGYTETSHLWGDENGMYEWWVLVDQLNFEFAY